MARNTNTRGVVFGTQSMSPTYQQQIVKGNSLTSQSNVATQFGASLSRTPIYMGRQKTARR